MTKEADQIRPQDFQSKLERTITALEKFDLITESHGQSLFTSKVSSAQLEPDYETRLKALVEVGESRERVVGAITNQGGLKDRLEEKKKKLEELLNLQDRLNRVAAVGFISPAELAILNNSQPLSTGIENPSPTLNKPTGLEPPEQTVSPIQTRSLPELLPTIPDQGVSVEIREPQTVEPLTEENIRELVSRLKFTPTEESILQVLLSEFQTGVERNSLAERALKKGNGITALVSRLSVYLDAIKKKLTPHGVTVTGVRSEWKGPTKYFFRRFEPQNLTIKPSESRKSTEPLTAAPIIKAPAVSEIQKLPPPVVPDPLEEERIKPLDVPASSSQLIELQAEPDHKISQEPVRYLKTPLDETEKIRIIGDIGKSLATTLTSTLVRTNQPRDAEYIPHLSRNILSEISATVVTAQERDSALRGIESEDARKSELLMSTIAEIENAWYKAELMEVGDGQDFRNIQNCHTLSKRNYSLPGLIRLVCLHFGVELPSHKDSRPIRSKYS